MPGRVGQSRTFSFRNFPILLESYQIREQLLSQVFDVKTSENPALPGISLTYFVQAIISCTNLEIAGVGAPPSAHR